MPAPARVVEERAGERDAIGPAFGDNRFGLMRVGDHADRLHRYVAGLFDRGGERYLVARRDARPRRRTDAAGGDADVIEADVAQLAGKYAGLIRRDPAVNPVGAGNAHAERLLARPDLADRGRHFERIPHAVGEAAAVAIRSPVGDRGEEAVQQKSVRGQQFDQVETQPLRAPCRFRMGVANTGQSSFIEGLRGRPAIVKRDGGWRCRRPGTGVRGKRPAALPRQPRRTLAAGMGKLNAERRRTRAAAEANNTCQRRLVGIGIEAETAVTDAARRFDRRLLDDDKPGAR